MPADIPVFILPSLHQPADNTFCLASFERNTFLLFHRYVIPAFFNAEYEYILLSTLSVFWGQFRAA
ncbi:hypothetical protein FZI51_09205 [Cronobacter sakazakii]|uniref:Uncharacterized protein n=1 Tax=Cronobacter sakazakii TaxID=28141 RepID=A0AAN5X699_CROSK|nr:hypothetical protein [Cronobacter sakazakii]EGT5693747.1 hypothetical protein [Cronobacter sakazakii]EGT5702253.1 hypothetical protein [Cronobacter sakazakii]EGT5717688.1 hypothetical protein [Cronobacter sakazakii]EGT5722811.1 hypothetical protein [Cronobacter sakazakii]